MERAEFAGHDDADWCNPIRIIRCMPSIIPDFAYDVFISYRQKDNTYDSWVTEFVNNLKKELAATFKETVSVYFDENLHDGLLENHQVDDSLKDKLKCVIFIPVISKTYCDVKSYAWSQEFLPFLKQAEEDSTGLKVRLPTGNVASRVIPVRIHEIDENDKALLEKELGSLRCVDFIYKVQGSIVRCVRRRSDPLITITQFSIATRLIN